MSYISNLHQIGQTNTISFFLNLLKATLELTTIY